jgi:VCBS repeat-containing protein
LALHDFSGKSKHAAGTFHAVDPDGNGVDFFGVSQGGTYTSEGGALVTINTADGGFTYTNTLPGAAFFHRATSENEEDRYDIVYIPVKSADGVEYTLPFKVLIIDGTNANPTGSSSVISTDAAGVVKGKVTGSDSDGDAMTYSLVGTSVNGLSGNSAYTKNGAGNGGIVTINAATGDFTYVSTSTAGASQSFQVRIGDGHGGSAIVTVTVPNTTSITPANDNTSTQNVVTGSVPSSTNQPGVFTGYALGSLPTKGTVTSFDPATGAFTYTRNSGLGHTTTPDDVVTVIATDANGRTVTLRMAVQPTVPNATPTMVLTTSPYSVAQAQNSSGNTLGTWSLNTSTWTQTTTGKLTTSDTDGDTLTYTVSTNSQAGKSNNGGTVTVNADGSFTYTIAKNKAYYHGAAIYSPTQTQNAANGASPNSAAADWFDVVVSDGFSGTATLRVYVPIYAVNATPTISGTRLGAGSIIAINVNDADSEDTYGNFQVVVPSGWNYVGAGGKNISTGTMTRLSGSNSASMTLYDRDGNGNRYYNVDAYGRTTNTQGVTRTW